MIKNVIALSTDKLVAILEDGSNFMVVEGLEFKEDQLVNYRYFTYLAHSLEEAVNKMEEVSSSLALKQRVLELKKAGLSFSAIAKELAYSKQNVHKIYDSIKVN